MIDIHSWFEFSRSHCTGICAFLVPANLLATLQTLIFVGMGRPVVQVRLINAVAILYALLMVLHVATWFMIGVPTPKAPPQDLFSIPKPAQTPEVKPVPVKQNYHDVAVHSASGTRIHRYAEVAPGQWKKIAELTPEQAAKTPSSGPSLEAPKTPEETPGDKRLD